MSNPARKTYACFVLALAALLLACAACAGPAQGSRRPFDIMAIYALYQSR